MGMGAPGHQRRIDWSQSAIEKAIAFVQAFMAARTQQGLPLEQKVREHIGVLEDKHASLPEMMIQDDEHIRDGLVECCASLTMVADYIAIHTAIVLQKVGDMDVEVQFNAIASNPAVPEHIRARIIAPLLITRDVNACAAERRYQQHDVEGMRLQMCSESWSEDDQQWFVARITKKICRAERGSFQGELLEKKKKTWCGHSHGRTHRFSPRSLRQTRTRKRTCGVPCPTRTRLRMERLSSFPMRRSSKT